MMYSMSDPREQLIDEILVMDSQDGNAKAIEILVNRWQKRLWQHAKRLTGDTEAAWDITQQSWIGIIKGLRRLQDPASFRSWAYRITTNKSIDWIKRSKDARLLKIEELAELGDEGKVETGIRELMEKLAVKKKAVLSLYYFEQLSVAEISSVLKVPAGTVKSRLSNARKELKELWHKYFDS